MRVKKTRQNKKLEPGFDQSRNSLGGVYTFAGAAYLVAVLLVSEALIAGAKVPYDVVGTSVWIAVRAVPDIEAQVRGRSLTRRWGNSS